MGRSSSSSIRLDIVGLEPELFQICKQNSKALIESRGKGGIVSTDTSNEPGPTLASIPKDQVALYNKIVSIAIDFERAYGRSVIIKVFKRSSNRVLNSLMRSQPSVLNPTFYVNGVKVFTGIPNSFSELDEAIDHAFGRKRATG
ncbi:MAG: hypothetical protein ACYCQJ_03000 [Nitrososphaerales archaeon]